MRLHVAQPAQYVVQIGHHHEQDDDAKAHIFGTNHELLRRLAARNHFVEQEQHVATIEGRNGQDVHEGQDDGEEGRHFPEHVPLTQF